MRKWEVIVSRALSEEVGKLRQDVSGIRRSMNATARPTPPPPTKVDVALGDGHILGDPIAKVGIVEFTDFQCPYCQRYHGQAFTQLKESYIETGKIQYAVRDFPLGFHNHAQPAAIASRCAGQQGQYWAMHHQLFANQKRLGADLYMELAKSLELKDEEFQSCMNDPVQIQHVEADLSYGQSIGVCGTPNFFIGRIQDGKLMNAHRISGSKPFSAFSSIIEKLLK